MKFYKTISEDDQFFIYDKKKDYGWFFNKWGVYGRSEDALGLLDLTISEPNFMKHFNKYIRDVEDARRDIIRNIM